MRTLIAAPFADTRAADLSLAYGLGPLPALAVHWVELPGAALELRVLGASHQVLAEVGGAAWSETVACLPERTGLLPATDESAAGGLRSWFTARCERLDPAELARRVGAVRDRCAAERHALIGTFPGSPDAVTALVARPEPGGGARWETWHAYPQSGELVTTTSVVRMAMRELSDDRSSVTMGAGR